MRVLKPSFTAFLMAEEEKVTPATSCTSARVESWPAKLGRKSSLSSLVSPVLSTLRETMRPS